MAFVDPLAAMQAQFTSSVSQVRKFASWRTNAKPDPVKRQPDTAYQMQIPADLQRRIATLMNAAAPALGNAFDRHLQPMAEAAFDEWPVRSGFSKSSISLDYAVEEGGGKFRGQLVVRAPYAAFIKERGKSGTTARRLLFRPIDSVALRIAADAADDIAKEVR